MMQTHGCNFLGYQGGLTHCMVGRPCGIDELQEGTGVCHIDRALYIVCHVFSRCLNALLIRGLCTGRDQAPSSGTCPQLKL